MNLTDLQREAHAIAKDHGWWDEERTFGDLIALVHSELSEALEAYREWGLKSVISATAPNDRTYRYFDINLSQAKVPDDWTTKPAGVASELADVVIRVADMAEWYEVDLDEAREEDEEFEEGQQAYLEYRLSGNLDSFGNWIAAIHEDVADAGYHQRTRNDNLGSLLFAVIDLIECMAAHYGIDLDTAIAIKMEYNKSRPYKHGGKAL